jgi:PAS domain S-box-containing protein
MRTDTDQAHHNFQSVRSRLEFLDRLGQEAAKASDADEILAITTRLTAEHLGLSNCAYADMDEDEDGFTIRGNWHAPGSPNIVGHYSLADFGTLAVQELSAGRPLVINDNAKELAPDEAKTFQEIGIAATICMPFVSGGRLRALMAIHDKVPHQWSQYEMDIIREVTERSWAHVERVGAEAELRASNERFRAAIQAISSVLWTNDAEGRMVGDQPGWESLTGQTFEEYQGYGWTRVLHSDDVEPTLKAWQAAVAERKMFVCEHRLTRADGECRNYAVRAVPVLGPSGEVTEWVGVHTDVTEQQAAATALIEESRILETLNRTGAALAAELDLSNIVQNVTDAGVELTGAQFGAFFYNVVDNGGDSYMLFALSGAKPEQFNFGMPRATAVFHPTFAGEAPIRSPDITRDPRYGKSEPHFGMPKGHLPVVSYLAVPVVSRSKEVLGGLFFGHGDADVFTERHERLVAGIAAQAAIAIDNARLYQAVQRANETLEQRVEERGRELQTATEALAQSQRLQALGQLTGGIAHDFNNLLTVIGGAAAIIQRRPNMPEERRQKFLDGITETVERATKLTEQLLAFGRRQAIKPEALDVDAVLQSFSEILSRTLGKQIEIILDLQANHSLVSVDRAQFESAVLNCAVNARDAMPRGGHLTISTHLMEEAGQKLVRVSVRDDGLGMPAIVRDRAFEPFFTTKEVGQGTGLGLSQIHGFAAQAGGRAELESAEGAGTTVSIFLPVTDHPPSQPRSRSSHRVLPTNLKILLVEDNAMVREFAVEMLQELACQVTAAENAAQALQMLETKLPDVVLSDVVMPGMSGLELARKIRRQHPRLPILLATGHSDELVNGECEFDVLSKPYATHTMIDGLLAALERLRA